MSVDPNPAHDPSGADLLRSLRLICALTAHRLGADRAIAVIPERCVTISDLDEPVPPAVQRALLNGAALGPDPVQIPKVSGLGAMALMPLADGGRLCVLADRDRIFSASDLQNLRDLAGLADARVATAGTARPAVPDAARSLARFGHWRLGRTTGDAAWSAEILELFGYPAVAAAPSLAMILAAFPPKTQTELRRGIARTWETGEEISIASSLTRRDAIKRDVLIRFRAERAEGGPVDPLHATIAGIMLDVTEARSFDERLQREKDLLQTTLDHMDQGLIVVEPDMSVPVLSQRTTELLDLPQAFAETRPDFPEILNYQYESGTITLEVLNSSINSFILNLEDLPEAHVYERETFDGKVLEVRTTKLPDGGFVRTFTDQTSRRRRDEEIARAQAEYRRLFENAVTGIYRAAINGRLQRLNPAFAHMHGYDAEADMLVALGDIPQKWYVDAARGEAFLQKLRNDGRVTDFMAEIFRHRTGEPFWTSETAWVIRDAMGQIVGYEGTVIEATERHRAEQRIAHMARHDGLTGLPNRLKFNEGLRAGLADGAPLAVLCLDLDRFKIVNDTLGHPAGDALLRTLAQRFTELLPDDCSVARFGGDEFAVLMPGADAPMAAAMAERVIAAVHLPVTLQGRPITVGVSIGIATAPDDGTDPTQLMKGADLALYRAKADGRDTYRFFAPAMDAAMQDRQQLELDLRDALARSEFTMLYQPVVRLADGAVIAYEALLRWTHPQRGLIPPETFIAIAEETRMIVPIGDWVLARACTDAARLPAGVDVSVNVSTVQLAQTDFEATLDRALQTSGLAPSRLVIEITETALMDLRIDVAPLLSRLRARGIRAALDDFGTGYSSLGYLRRFDFDILKIDRSFACALQERETAAIVATVLDLGARLGIQIIAEGVETADQLAALRAAGCAYVQGHLFSEPRPIADVFG